MVQHILVVEDDPATLLLMSSMLAAYRVTRAETVADALAALAGGRFDLVLSDWNLPDGRGGSVVRASAAAGTPALVITAGPLSSASGVGAAAVLGKPLTRQGLLAAVAQYLKRAPGIVHLG